MKSGIHFTSREIAQLALLSSLWAVIEIQWGFLLKSLKIPFSGAVLTTVAVILLCLGRSTVPKRGTALLMGITVAFIKMIVLGGIAIYSILGIIIEVALVEIGLGSRGARKRSFILAGALGVLWSLFHPFFAQGVLAGWGIIRVYMMIIGKGASISGLNERQALLIFALLIAYHIGMGVLAGYLGWQLPRLISRRAFQTNSK